MGALTNTIAAVRRLIKDTDATIQYLADAEVTEAVNAALRRYNRDRPRVLVEDITGDGGRYYLLSSSLTDWVRGFSTVLQVDYDVGTRITSDEDPELLEPIEWEIYLSATDTEYLYLVDYAPSASEDVRVWYTTPHDHSDSADTVYAEDVDPLRWLAAAVSCEILATRASATSDTTINADSVSYQSKQRQYSEEAGKWAKMYYDHVGAPADGGPAPAAGVADWDRGSFRSGRRGDYLTHGRWTR